MNDFLKYYKVCTDNLRQDNMYRNLHEMQRFSDGKVRVANKDYTSFCCNDYLGLSFHEEIKGSAINAIKEYGVGSAASRFITGNNPIYDELEKKLASYKNTEDAIVFGSGYLTNIGVISSLVGKDDLIIADKLVHACMIDGAKLSQAKLIRFKHNDIESCIKKIISNRSKYNKCLIIVETVYSMDGDLAPIDELLKVAQEHDCLLLSDDAHGFATVGKKMVSSQRHIQVGTLSKAIASYGGYVCASDVICDYIRNMARSVIFTTALPASVLSAASKALDLINDNADDFCQKPLQLAKYFTNLLGLPEADSQIVSVILGDAKDATVASDKLKQRGFMVLAIRPPTVPKGTSRLRFTFSALHNKSNVEELANSIKEENII